MKPELRQARTHAILLIDAAKERLSAGWGKRAPDAGEGNATLAQAIVNCSHPKVKTMVEHHNAQQELFLILDHDPLVVRRSAREVRDTTLHCMQFNDHEDTTIQDVFDVLNRTQDRLQNLLGAENEKQGSMNIKQLMTDLFGSLPAHLDGRFLCLRFVSPAEVLVCYSDESGEDLKLVETFKEKETNWVTRCVLSLAAGFSHDDIINGCVNNPELDEDELSCIVRDIELIFSVLPPSIVYTGGRMKLRGSGKKFDLRVDVDASSGRLSWLVQYVHTDVDAIAVSFAPMGADDDADYWHNRMLTKVDLLWGMQHNFSISMDSAPFQISFVDGPFLPNLKQSIMAQKLNIPIERSRELLALVNSTLDQRNGGDLEKAIERTYEEVSAHCENANELFFIAWAHGKGLC